jgi:methylmalonyl-CoA mutase
MAETTKRLFSEFPEVTTRQWEERINADLKGKDYDKALVWRTNEGIKVMPYYRAENLSGLEFLMNTPGEFPFVRGTGLTNDWLIRQDINAADFAVANKKALEVLGKGVNSLGFIINASTQVTAGDLSVLLKDICLEAAEVNIICSCRGCNITGSFIELAESGPWEAVKVIGSVNNDPLGDLIAHGNFHEGNREAAFKLLSRQVKSAASLPGFRTIVVNGKIYGNSGASVIQELAFSLAQAAEYIVHLTESDMHADEAASAIKFDLSIGNNYFMEIAKLRAGRLLWAQIVKAFGVTNDNSAKMIVHSETSGFNKTVYDPYTNLLRTQTEAMSAALGGAHSVKVLPFDAFYQTSSDIAERIARNQQILLKEEAYLNKISDPAGGAYYIESLTASVAEEAWQLFLTVQEAGGFIAAAEQGIIQQQVKEMAARRVSNIAMRNENLLGVNQFPNFGEVISANLDEKVFSPSGNSHTGAVVETLQPFRGAAAFEELRYKTDRYALEHGRPLVFMLTIGNAAMRKARAQFACNFFAVAGFEVADNNGFNSVEEGLEAARAAKAAIIVVCSSDEEYADLIPPLAGKVGEEILVVAGNPACRPDLEACGVKNFIHVRSNLLNELSRYQDLIIG